MEETELISNESLEVDLSTRQLRAFATVAQTRSYAQAAEFLHYTEQGVFAQVKRLEQLIGRRLLVRHGRGVHLTNEGLAILPACQLVLADLERLERIRRRIGSTQLVTVAASAVAGSYLLPPLIRAFTGEQEISIDLLPSPVEQILNLVDDGTADLGVSGELEYLSLPEDLSLEHWVDVPASLFVANGLRRAFVSPVAVFTTLHAPQLTGNLHRQLMEHGLAEHQIRTVPSMEAIKGACAAGLGYGALPRAAAQLELQAGLIRELDGFRGTLGGPAWICQPSDEHRSPEARSFARFLQQHTELVRVFLTLN
jgi:DNA-binding transcriptional LysR family regulator